MRVLVCLGLVLVATIAAGIYGALHNQISYSVAPEYFTAFKFEQFDIDPDLPDRLGAAVVGWHASWWMGFLIGGLLGPVGLVIRGRGRYAVVVLQALGLVVATALAVGLGGLLYGVLTLQAESLPPREGVHDIVAFWRAGTMHNMSYLGGGVGIIVGLGWIAFQARRERVPREQLQEAA